ncbi:MAG: type II toxin-antitoxin system RelE/ParE family toxin [Acidobacteria bacterium]|nr:type II toxin-antitoxin system RelE/ParE family toxin [Acidobacteriota bacterium]MBU4203235.1 type II toxin-antitoxin system RelE/ParE family toxin [Acidobacteriota bacterium]
MKLLLTNTFKKKFNKLPLDVQKKIKESLLSIYEKPFLGKKLMGDLEGEFSCRVGKYRIIYFIDENDNIWIETVGHRKDVYRRK